MSLLEFGLNGSLSNDNDCCALELLLEVLNDVASDLLVRRVRSERNSDENDFSLVVGSVLILKLVGVQNEKVRKTFLELSSGLELKVIDEFGKLFFKFSALLV